MRKRKAARPNPFTVLIGLIMALVLIGQVVLVIRINTEKRKANDIRTEISALTAERNNLQVSLAQYQKLDRVRDIAVKLGMIEPRGDNIRVISVDTGKSDNPITLDASHVE